MERRLQLIGNACSSSMVLAQRHIQLGTLHKMEAHQNYLGIENFSRTFFIEVINNSLSLFIRLPHPLIRIVYQILNHPF